MIISENHILLEKHISLTHILLACAYSLHLIIKNIKKALIHKCNYLLSKQTPQTETNILPIATPFSNICKQLTATIHRIWQYIANDTTLSTIWSSKHLLTYTKSSSIHNCLAHSAQACGSSRQDS